MLVALAWLVGLGGWVVPHDNASAATVIPTGALWGFRPGTNEASAPVSAWRQPGFDARDFAPRAAPFWYGDVLEGGTEITGMQGVYGCVFLRKPFVVQGASTVTALRLRALVDDGFVAWINGTEVLRVGVSGAADSAVAVTTLAVNAAEPVSFATYPLPTPAGYLREGTNVLAVQVFQSSLTSSDLGFEAALESVIEDTTPPRIVGLEPSPGSTVTRLEAVTVQFSEPVRGVVAAHLRVNGVGATSVTAEDPNRYVFRFVQPAYGRVALGWQQGGVDVLDEGEPPNRLDAASLAEGWSLTLVDRTPPAIVGLTPTSGTTVRTLSSVAVLFGEAVEGVDAADLRINGRPADRVSRIGPSQYIFEFAEPARGRVRLTWATEHGIVDTAIPPNVFVGTEWEYQLDPDAAELAPYISEFLASNTRTLRDDTGQYTDWVELHNPSDVPVDLGGWYLTDGTNQLTRWRFPSTNLPAGGFLVVFASGLDRRVPGQALHTDFQLSAAGEFLGLVRPDGTTVASGYAPVYPRQVPDVSHGVVQVERALGGGWDMGPRDVYFTKPTPGAPNLGGTAVPGPAIEEVGHTPNVPRDDQDLRVTARVRATFQAVSGVTLGYRVMHGVEGSTPMFDDGAHGDGTAGDGVFGAVLPASLAAPGQMIRYRILAIDTAGASSRWPLFTQSTATPEYLGTIVEPTNAASVLPVFHLFVAPTEAGRVDSESGGRVSVFHDGEFYDNVAMEVRGNTSAGLSKKSHRLEFNRGHELRHGAASVRTRRTSLLAEYLDPTYLRQHLCFWLLDRIGVPAPFNQPVRVHLNGQFYQLAFHSDVIGSEQMERMGYDPRGALYKAVGNLVPSFASTGVFQKLEPEGDSSRTDYLQLANGIRESVSLASRRAAVFDLLDVPQVINHLAGTRWCAENDDVWANMSLYRDTFGDGLWRNIPFDMNASWGQLYGGSSPLEATVDNSKSHPLYGGSSTEPNFNRLYDVIVRLPETREMLLRRQRSVLDQMVQPPETPEADRILEGYIRQMTNRIAPEAALDRARWGFSPWAPGKTFAAGVGDLINQFIIPRRRHWYVTHSITNTAKPIGITTSSNAGIPLSQPADASPEIVDVEFNPSSGNQAQEYVVLTNRQPIALDLSGWKLTGAVQFTFRPGTVLPSRGGLHVSPDVRQFRARTAGPRGGLGLFVVGPYSGQLSARGETVEIRDRDDRVRMAFPYAGAPSAAQRFLRITEVHYRPAAMPGNPADPEEFEFVELRNLSTTEPLDLNGVRLVDGVQFDLGTSAIRTLAPGARLLVVANPVAFAARYGSGRPVAGSYTGRLDNGGERIRLVDASGEEVLDFEYNDAWYPTTDGGGRSLEVSDDSVAPDAWSNRTTWRASAEMGGSPGRSGDTLPLGWPEILVQPVGGTVVAGGTVGLSVIVSHTAALPLGIELWRAAGSSEPLFLKALPSAAREGFVTLAGAEVAPPWTRFFFRITNAVAPAGVTSAVAVVTYAEDTDADRLSDAWELATWGHLREVATSDPDGDGQDNRAEAESGTDPVRAESALRLEWAGDGRQARLRFRAEGGRTYAMQVTESLVSPRWRTISGVPAMPDSRVVEVEDLIAIGGTETERWYRLVTPWMPGETGGPAARP